MHCIIFCLNIFKIIFFTKLNHELLYMYCIVLFCPYSFLPLLQCIIFCLDSFLQLWHCITFCLDSFLRLLHCIIFCLDSFLLLLHFSRVGHTFFSKERNVLAFFYILYKRMRRSLHFLTFFLKECGVLYILLRSL